MAILDGLMLVDNNTALTVTRASTDHFDIGAARDLGFVDDPLVLFFQFNTLPTAAGAATVTVSIQSSANGSTGWTDRVVAPARAISNFTAADPSGGVFLFFPPGVADRFWRVNYTVGTGPLTAGTVTAGITLYRDMQRYYPRNYSA